jgi:site-specific recombinase XerD
VPLPLAAARHHVDLWVRHPTTEPQSRTGRPAAPATVARTLSALSGFYEFGVHDAEVLTHSPVASVQRPRVADDNRAVGLTSDELRRPLATAAARSPRSAALATLLTFRGLRISEALGADIRDYGHAKRLQDRLRSPRRGTDACPRAQAGARCPRA